MNIVPVIFEDHNLARMRPLSWSAPVFELRCGMFNTRERVGLCSSGGGGVLLGRNILRDLNRASGWAWGSESIPVSGSKDTRFLFLNGMLAPDFSLIRGLFDLARDCPELVWSDGQELVAAVVGPELARKAAVNWESWEKENAGRSVWTDPSNAPLPWSGGDFFAGEVAGPSPDVIARLVKLAKLQNMGPSWIWDIVGCTKDALVRDRAFVKDGVAFKREPFGIFPGQDQSAPDWAEPTILQKHSDGDAQG